MSIKSSKVTIGIFASLCLVATAASAQVQTQDDRFTPRVYGSLAVTPAYVSEDAARISGINQSRNVVVTPISKTGTTQIIPSSSTTGTYATQSYGSEVQAEAQRVIAFQNANRPSISETYTIEGAQYNVVPQNNIVPQERRYAVELFEPAQAPIQASTQAPIQSFATHTLTAAQSHYVDEGDTLYGIAKRYNTNVDAIRTSNGLSGNDINIGQTLTIPSTSRHILTDSTVNATSFETAPRSNVIRTVQPIPNRGVYAVLPKDTLYSISKRACVTVEGIQAQNRLGENTEITPGQRLNMPAGHCLN